MLKKAFQKGKGWKKTSGKPSTGQGNGAVGCMGSDLVRTAAEESDKEEMTFSGG